MRWSSRRSWLALLLFAAIAFPFAAGALSAQGTTAAGPAGKDAEAREAADLYNSLRDVINYGAELFNKQADHAGCYRVYQGSLIAVRPYMAPEMRKKIDDTIVRAEGLPYYSERAFELRRVLDEIRTKWAPGKTATKTATPAVAGPQSRPPVTKGERPAVTAPTTTQRSDPPKVVDPPKAVITPKPDLPKIVETPAPAPAVVPPPGGAPKVAAPTIEAPKVAAPTIEAPKVDPPKVEGPPTGLPTVKPALPEPKVETPKVELPKVELPKVETPKTTEKKVDVPKVVDKRPDLPKIDLPKVETPKVELPRVDTPKPELPKVETPKAQSPKVELPKVDLPKVELPKVELPKVDLPKVEQPKVNPSKTDPKKPEPPKVVPPAQLPSDPLVIPIPPVETPKDKKETAKVSPPSVVPPSVAPPPVAPAPVVPAPVVPAPVVPPPVVPSPLVPPSDPAKVPPPPVTPGVDSSAKGDKGVVAGMIVLDGKPLPTGYFVTLVSAEGKRFSTLVQKDGAFQFATPLGVGAYKVAIEALPGEPGSITPIPTRYRDETTSGLILQVSAGRVMPELRLTK